MKKIKICSTLLLLLCFGILELKAQSSLNAAGGTATGAGGSASYSVGQLVYTTATGGGGSSNQGVQQPYELFTATHEELQSIQLILEVYPNPTSTVVFLKVTDPRWSQMDYQLFDINGRLLEDQKLDAENTSIPMENKPLGTYFLKVTHENQEIKSFKILKNQ